MNPLKQLQENPVMREAVKAYMLETLKELAVERVFAQKDIKGIYEAQEVVEKTFTRLQEEFGEKKKIVVESSR